MQKLLLYLLIPVMLIQSNMTLLITTSFYYNQNYIEKYLCLQRNMENNSCHGQCYLSKKLKQQQEKEQASFKVHFHESFVKSVDTFEFSNPVTLEVVNTEFNLYSSNLNPKDIKGTLFHPPLI